MAVSGESESKTDFSEDVLFEDIESVYSASKIKRGKDNPNTSSLVGIPDS